MVTGGRGDRKEIVGKFVVISIRKAVSRYALIFCTYLATIKSVDAPRLGACIAISMALSVALGSFRWIRVSRHPNVTKW